MDTNATIPKTDKVPLDERKKYIRTFAGDMETLKKGGIPDLVPLADKKAQPPKPKETPVEEDSSLPPTPIPASNVGHVPGSPLSIQFARNELPTEPLPLPPPPPIEILQAEVPTPPPEMLSASAPESIKPTPLKTYASDFSDRMKEVHASTATVLAAEQDAVPQMYQSAPGSSQSGFFYILAGVALLVASGFGVYFAYTHYSASLAPIILAPTVSAPIFVDEREQISGNGAALLQAINQSINKPLAESAVRLLYTADATTTNNSVFLALHEPAPNVLLRNINASGGMAGIVNTGGSPSNTLGTGQSPFFILSVSSYNNTFSGMLSWEATMSKNLEPLFPRYEIASTTATTTIAGFRDEVVGNHDVRIYRNTAGQSVLLYGYWNQETLIIARDPAAFAEILQRLATSRTQ